MFVYKLKVDFDVDLFVFKIEFKLYAVLYITSM